MRTNLFGISVDCADAAAVARFWGAVLGRQVADAATSENAVLLADDTATSGPRLAFHQVPEAKVVKNRLHIDLVSDSFDADTERLVSLGAQKLRDMERGNARWTTFADIEGNEFDLIAGERRD
ncbi:MAG TPA: VOC family protein [Acidimicrobiia bacterium]